MESDILTDASTELAVVAAAAFSAGARGQILHEAGDATFATPAAAAFWRAIRVLVTDGSRDVDTVSLTAQLVRSGDLEDAGGGEAADRLQLVYAATRGDWRKHLSDALDFEAHRRHMSAAISIAEAARDLSLGRDELASRASDAIAAAVTRGASGRTELAEAATGVVEETRRLMLSPNGGPGITTGIAQLDDLVGGWKPGHLITVGAGTGVGKTTFAITTALAAMIHDYRVIYFAYEMSAREIAQKAMAAFSGVPFGRMSEGNIDDGEMESVERAADLVHDGFLVVDNGVSSPAEMTAICRGYLGDAPGLVVVDYLQLMAEAEPRESRYEAVSRTSRSLKLMARELESPVISLSQLSRAYRHRQNPAPRLSDLRESGSIEQDSDEVLMLDRSLDSDEGYGRPAPNELYVYVRKSRYGRCGRLACTFDGETSRIM